MALLIGIENIFFIVQSIMRISKIVHIFMVILTISSYFITTIKEMLNMHFFNFFSEERKLP